MSAYRAIHEQICQSRTSVMMNILKKYSRAAGDRSQWKKVEAMFNNNSDVRKAPTASILVWSVSRAPIPPFVALNTLKQLAHNTMSTRTTLRDQDNGLIDGAHTLYLAFQVLHRSLPLHGFKRSL
jgi:hypothetical protein